MRAVPVPEQPVAVTVSTTEMSIAPLAARVTKMLFVPCPEAIVPLEETLQVQLRPATGGTLTVQPFVGTRTHAVVTTGAGDGLVRRPDCVTPSDQVRLQGGVPVSAAPSARRRSVSVSVTPAKEDRASLSSAPSWPTSLRPSAAGSST